MEIDLTINKGFKWYQKKNIWAKGFLFDLNNTLYEEEKVLEYFSDIKNKDDFEQKLKSANGFFQLLSKHPMIFLQLLIVFGHILYFF